MKTFFVLVALLATHIPLFAQATAEDLKKYLTNLHAAQIGGKTDEAAKMTAALIPDAARLKKGLADSVPANVFAKIEKFYAELPKEPAALSKMIAPKPEETEIQVHGATTEEIAAFVDGSVARKKFPGAAKEAAEKGLLRPKVTFYEVEFVKPGSDLGTDYHLFYHDGTAWTMLGRVWRAAR
jgi:hypothetical protein